MNSDSSGARGHKPNVSQQRNTMITKNGLLRPNKTSPLLGATMQKSKPQKMEPNEADIDFTNIPTIHGSYQATKINISGGSHDAPKSDTKIQSGTISIRKDSPAKIEESAKDSADENTSFPTISTTTLPTIKAETSISTPTTSSSKINDPFKNFSNPSFEESPWRPIIPNYVNTELKLLPQNLEPVNSEDFQKFSLENLPNIPLKNKEKTEYGVVSTSQKPSIDEISLTTIIPVTEDIKFNLATVKMDPVDVEIDFPPDRIVPQEMVNFRPNGKFKNKIPGIDESSQSKIEIDSNPEIEISGHLPEETFDLHLKTSPGSSTITEFIPDAQNPPESFPKIENPIKTGEILDSSKNDANLRPIDQIEISGMIERPDELIISGIGVAEPVLEHELDFESRNKFSDIFAVDPVDEKVPSEKKNEQELSSPFYTSYRTPELNGYVRPSLIENPGTLKPFKHMIPVDKINLEVLGDFLGSVGHPEGQSDSLELDTTTASSKILQTSSKIDKNSSKTDGIFSTKMEEIINPKENENSSLEPIKSIPPLVENISETLINPPIIKPIELLNNSPGNSLQKIDEKFQNSSTTELNLKTLPSSFKGAEGPSISSTSEPINSLRNSTFIEVDTVEHIPGSSQTENNDKPVFFENESSMWKAGNESATESGIKTYNDTLKANIVKSLVTLPPVKSNIGLGKPLRPRPKGENEKVTRDLEKKSDETVSNEQVYENILKLQELLNPFQEQQKKIIEENNKHSKSIVKIVTSVSTKVSTKVKGDDIVMSFDVTNSTSGPLVNPEVLKNPDSSEQIQSSPEEINPDNSKQLRAFDQTNLTEKEKQSLLEKLKKFAEIRVDNDSSTVKNKNLTKIVNENSSNHDAKIYENISGMNFNKLKEFADIAMGNQSIKNVNESQKIFLSRDGIEILTKILHKVDDEPTKNKIISTTEKIGVLNLSECSSGFLCNDGKCLPATGRCNMLGECTNSEDETNCTCADFLRAQLLVYKICDGIPDCWDYSDETDCDWCAEGQFVCGNNRHCVDQGKVCDGFWDCPGGDDEKKCAALIEDEKDGNPVDFNGSKRLKEIDEKIGDKIQDKVDENLNKFRMSGEQDSKELSSIESTTIRLIPHFDKRAEKSTNQAGFVEKSAKVVGREIPSSSKNDLTGNSANGFHVSQKMGVVVGKTGNVKEINGYSDRGFLSVRKNGKWGKLCLNGMEHLMEERRALWTIEDLGRAVCKAITYQSVFYIKSKIKIKKKKRIDTKISLIFRDYENVEKVTEDRHGNDKIYYSLFFNDKITDKTSLTFKLSTCPTREVLRVKCKNLECGIRTQTTSQAR